MFILARLRDTVCLHPAKSHSLPLATAITNELDSRYANRIVPHAGLCIRIFDILSASDPIILPSEPFSQLTVVFRAILLRPVEGEVCVGRIRNAGPEGIHLSMGFFEDVFVAADDLPTGSLFDPNERVWLWVYEGARLFMDDGEEVRFRALGCDFNPVPPSPIAPTANARAPMSIRASFIGDGLGPTAWWSSS